jgi:hypothetical protein
MKSQKICASRVRCGGFTLIDILIGVFLVSIIFLTIYGMYQLNLVAVRQSKTRILAAAIANGEMEKIKNLPYRSVGTIGGFPEGVLESSTTTVKNGISFDIATQVNFVVDSTDGIASPADDCPNDYKRAQVKVSWSTGVGGEVISVTDMAPKNLAEECATGGGILSVSVSDGFGNMVVSPLIEIKNPATGGSVSVFSPIEGVHYFSLATSTYRVVVSKSGYSYARTYGTDEVTTPSKPDPGILEGDLTELSFMIDKVSSLSVFTKSPWGADYFADSFLDESRVSEKINLAIKNSLAELATDTAGYFDSGDLISNEILPVGLVSWDEFSFSDSKPADTDLDYKIYFATDTIWALVPESDLPGNSIGFDSSPVDLSGLSAASYPKLKIKADFSTISATATPSLYDWQVHWTNNLATFIPNAPFKIRGDKIIGKDSLDSPVYKYSIATTTDASGHKNLTGLETDLYTFSIDSGTGLDLVSSDPALQPINLPPDFSAQITLYLDSQNSLLLQLQNALDNSPIFAAAVRLRSVSPGYDNTQYTDSRGQTYFIPLASGNYSLEVSALNYFATSSAVYVTGDKIKTLGLSPD